MKHILWILLLLSDAAFTQGVYHYFPPPGITYGLGAGLSLGSATGGVQGPGTINAQGLFVNGIAVATGGSPGGSTGQLQYNNSGAFGGFALGGDCSFSQPNITCLKTGGVLFGTAATANTGTSGATIPVLNSYNTWSATQSFAAILTTSITDSAVTGLTQCLHANSSGLISGTGSDCGSGSGSSAFNALTSGTNTTAAMVVGSGASINVAGSGVNNANAINGTAVPISATVLSSNSSMQLAAAATTGTGAIVEATSPTLVTPVLGTPASGVATNLTGLPPATGIAAGNLASSVLSSAGNALVDTAGTATVFNKNLSSPTNTIVLFASGTGASAVGTNCSVATSAIGARADTKLGGGSLTTGGSGGTCVIAFTLPTLATGWACSVTDVSSQVLYVQTVFATNGCTVSGVATPGDRLTLIALGS
jgi:hypothetical protein